jgi:glycosyl transferase family 25
VSDADLNGWFAHKVCLNLDRRPERWSRMQERFAKHGISGVVRFSAIDGERVDIPSQWQGTAGAYGCLQSNLAVVKQARDNGWPDVLLFEDDVVFDDDLTTKLPRFMAQVPPDWDMLFFGGMHRDEPQRVRENVLKLTASTSTYAYAVRSTLYPAFLETHSGSRQPIDLRNRVLQETYNCYCFFPHLAWVDGGLSDTQGRPVDPWWLKESLILGGPTLARIQRSTLVVTVHEASARRDLAQRNLIYSVNAYRRLLEGATVVVVEQRRGGTVSAASTLTGCAHLSIDAEGPINRGRCVNEAVRQFGEAKDFYLFVDRDIVPTWDAKGHLLKCLEYDVASSFRRLIDLSEEDSRRLMNGEPMDGASYSARPRRGLYAECCTFTRDAFQKSGGWEETGATRDGDEMPSGRAGARLSVFDSPALGVRLFSDHGGAAGGRSEGR